MKIRLREFVNIYKEFFPDGEPQNFAEWVFRAFDTKNQEIFIKNECDTFCLSRNIENDMKGSINFDQFIRAVAIIGHGTIGELDELFLGLRRARYPRTVSLGYVENRCLIIY